MHKHAQVFHKECITLDDEDWQSAVEARVHKVL